MAKRRSKKSNGDENIVKSFLERYQFPSFVLPATAHNLNRSGEAYDVARAYNKEYNGVLPITSLEQFYAMTGVRGELALEGLLEDARKHCSPGHIGNPILAKAVEGYTQKFNESLKEAKVREVLGFVINNGYCITEQSAAALIKLADKYKAKMIKNLDEEDPDAKKLKLILTTAVHDLTRMDLPANLAHAERERGLIEKLSKVTAKKSKK